LWQDSGMDVIGLTGYFTLVGEEPQQRIPYREMVMAYRDVLRDYVVPLQTITPDKPIVFVEFGYTDSIRSPWLSFAEGQTERVWEDQDSSGIDDGAETQADIIRAFFQANRELGDLVKGAFLWGHDWTDDPLWTSTWGSKRVFGVRDKLAEEVVKAEYGAGSALYGTVRGTVFDQANGTTPVHPVAVDLADAVTGEWLGNGTEVNPDGSYEIGGVPAGDYKIFFNAYHVANGYIDELYSEVACDNGSCDVATLGDAFTIAPGLNSLDVQLEPRIALSGTVSTATGFSIHSTQVEVRDETGQVMGSPAQVDQDGQWAHGLPGPGTYFARTLPESTPGLMSEVWNDVACEDCDPTTAGTPIVVDDTDVTDIDFQLSPPVYESYDCRARRTLFRDDFQARDGIEIVFLTGESRTITEEGQVVGFSAQLLDEAGAAIDSSRLQWCLTNTDHLFMEAAGPAGTITATGMAIQSSEVVVIDPVSGAEARGMVVMADLREDAALIDGDFVVSASQPARGQTSTLVLARSPATEALAAGMVIALDDRTGILVRIVSTAVVGDTIELLVEPAGLHEFYASARIESSSSTSSYRLIGEGNGPAKLQRMGRGGEVIESIGGGLFDCDADVFEASATPMFDIEFETQEFFVWEADPIFDLLPVNWQLISIGQGTGPIALDSRLAVEPKFNCKITGFPSLPVAYLPAGPIVLGFKLQPNIGLKGGVVGASSFFDIPLPGIQVDLAWAVGLQWDQYGGVRPLFYPDALRADWRLTPRSVDPGEFEFSANLTPYVGGTLEFGLAPAGPFFSIIDYEYSKPYSGGINPPLDWRDRNYVGPSWTISRRSEFTPGTDIEDAASFLAGQLLGGIYEPGISLSPIYEDSEVTARSPEPLDFAAECMPDDCPVNTDGDDYVDWSVALPEDYEFNGGGAELVGWKDGATDAVIVSSDSQPDPISGIGADWYPSTDDIGSWNLRGMLWESGVIDIGRYFPYPAGTGGRQVQVAQTWTLNVMLEGQAGSVSSSPAGINCQWSSYPDQCTSEYADQTQVTLTASQVPDHTFAGWSGGGCEDSGIGSCTITLAADTFVSARYEALPEYQVTVGKRWTSGGTTGDGRVTSNEPGIDCGSNCAASFTEGTLLSLTAKDTAGGTFQQWADDSPVCPGSTSRVCSFTVELATTAVAVFVEEVAVTAQRASSNTGLDIPGGFISSNPSGISCGDSCSAGFQSGALVTLTASASQGWAFKRWMSPSECADAPENASPNCTFTPTGSTIVRAEFTPDPVTLVGLSFGSYFDVDEVCSSMDASASTILTLSYTGTMEEGASLSTATDVDNSGSGVFDRGAPIPRPIFSDVTKEGGSVIFQTGFCWGTPTTVLRHRIKYVDPVGGESNEIQRIVSRP